MLGPAADPPAMPACPRCSCLPTAPPALPAGRAEHPNTGHFHHPPCHCPALPLPCHCPALPPLQSWKAATLCRRAPPPAVLACGVATSQTTSATMLEACPSSPHWACRRAGGAGVPALLPSSTPPSFQACKTPACALGHPQARWLARPCPACLQGQQLINRLQFGWACPALYLALAGMRPAMRPKPPLWCCSQCLLANTAPDENATLHHCPRPRPSLPLYQGSSAQPSPCQTPPC